MESAKPSVARMAKTGLGLAVTGLFGVFASKVLDRWGVLEGPANHLGDLLRANVSGADLALLSGFVIFLVLSLVVIWGVWRRPISQEERRMRSASVQGVEIIDKNRPIFLLSKGDQESEDLANWLTGHLIQEGITIGGRGVGTLSPPPETNVSYKDSGPPEVQGMQLLYVDASIRPVAERPRGYLIKFGEGSRVGSALIKDCHDASGQAISVEGLIDRAHFENITDGGGR